MSKLLLTGKIERWHKTLKEDCIREKVPLSLDDARRIVKDFTTHYNDVRLHSAIGYVAPKDRLEGRHQTITDERDRKLDQARETRKQKRQAQSEEHERQKCQPTVTPQHAPRPAIDFAAVRAALTIAAVLQLLGLRPRSAQGAQHRGPCPLHGSTSGTARCFSAHLDRNVFHCFKCGTSGNALDLWAHANRQSPYDAALDLCQRLAIPLPLLTTTRNGEEEPVAEQTPNPIMPSP